MNAAATFLGNWLCWWISLTLTYAAVIAGFEWIRASRRHRQARQHHEAELARIDQQTDASVQRIATAFHSAQQQVQEEAALVDGWRAIIRPWPEHTETDHRVTAQEGQPA
ncbi:hypothetical protein [Mycobacteroides abscessus]|uniref:hypothetical protein n=1 Tax=Mycobacteroides abscessus TaxID=36809 RepID=UPI0012FFECAA|nr:hypothetical protein [Mycobacteroides abscessus]